MQVPTKDKTIDWTPRQKKTKKIKIKIKTAIANEKAMKNIDWAPKI
jgi:hypothetical protein